MYFADMSNFLLLIKIYSGCETYFYFKQKEQIAERYIKIVEYEETQKAMGSERQSLEKEIRKGKTSKSDNKEIQSLKNQLEEREYKLNTLKKGLDVERQKNDEILELLVEKCKQIGKSEKTIQ